MQRIKRDDVVRVRSGKERGKQGQVREVFPRKASAYVHGLNMVKRHQKQRSERNPAGIIDKEAPIHLSNLTLICKLCQQPTRVTMRVRQDGVKVRVCRKCGQDID